MRMGRSPTLEGLHLCQIESAQPQAFEVRVRLRASSLNYHDFAVVTGILSVGENLIPLSDGAGEVTAVGDCVTRFAVKKSFMDRYVVHQVGAAHHTEWWIPAEDLDELNRNIVGLIEVVREYRA